MNSVRHGSSYIAQIMAVMLMAGILGDTEAYPEGWVGGDKWDPPGRGLGREFIWPLPMQ